MSEAAARHRLIAVELDEQSLGRGTPDQEHERRIAAVDLVEENTFAVPGGAGGPYRLLIGVRQGRLALEIREADGGPVATHLMSLSPLRAVLRDYALICDSYYAAIRTATPEQIEAIDMGRRGLHDEAAVILESRLAGKVSSDHATMRRLFTLVAALHSKG